MANQEDENMTVEKFLEIQFQVILDVSSYSSFYVIGLRFIIYLFEIRNSNSIRLI